MCGRECEVRPPRNSQRRSHSDRLPVCTNMATTCRAVVVLVCLVVCGAQAGRDNRTRGRAKPAPAPGCRDGTEARRTLRPTLSDVTVWTRQELTVRSLSTLDTVVEQSYNVSTPLQFNAWMWKGILLTVGSDDVIRAVTSSDDPLTRSGEFIRDIMRIRADYLRDKRRPMELRLRLDAVVAECMDLLPHELKMPGVCRGSVRSWMADFISAKVISGPRLFVLYRIHREWIRIMEHDRLADGMDCHVSGVVDRDGMLDLPSPMRRSAPANVNRHRRLVWAAVLFGIGAIPAAGVRRNKHVPSQPASGPIPMPRIAEGILATSLALAAALRLTMRGRPGRSPAGSVLREELPPDRRRTPGWMWAIVAISIVVVSAGCYAVFRFYRGHFRDRQHTAWQVRKIEQLMQPLS